MKRVLLALLLSAACTSGGGEAKPTATPSTSPTPVDAYTALTPPISPGIGDVDKVYVNRAYLAAQGLLAEALLEKGSLTGADDAQLAKDLAGASEDTGVTAAITGRTAVGLDYRPLLAPGVTVADSGFAEVVRSQWGGQAVTGRSGETALRITWSGAIRYTVTYQGTEREVAYTTQTGWIFEPSTTVPGEISLIATLRGKTHIVPRLATCPGVIVPLGPEPTDVDYTEGPYSPPPLASPAPCPLTK